MSDTTRTEPPTQKARGAQRTSRPASPSPERSTRPAPDRPVPDAVVVTQTPAAGSPATSAGATSTQSRTDAEHPTTEPAAPADKTETSQSPETPAPRTRAEMRAYLEEQARAERATARGRRAKAKATDAGKATDDHEVADHELIGPDGKYITRRTLRERRRAARERIGPTYVLREIAVVLTLALVLSFVLKTWLVQPFYIPSGSMEDTLQIGDRVLVSKLTPNPQSIERGDIVVFEDPDHWLDDPIEVRRTAAGNALHDALVFVGLAPNDANNHLIKRVIGLPGDHVKCCTVDGLVTVNGAPIHEPYLKARDVPSIDPFDITVPKGRLWVMGDHRSNSGDSRYHPLGGDGSQGSVPESKVVGRAVAVAWPFDRMTWLSRPSSVFSSVPDPKK